MAGNASESLPPLGPEAEDGDETYLNVAASKYQSPHVAGITKKLEQSIQTIEKSVETIVKTVKSQEDVILTTTEEIPKEYLDSYKLDYK